MKSNQNMASTRILQISRKLIKPSFPTPPALKTYKLSRFEQSSDHNYTPLSFFFGKNSVLQNGEISQLLQRSLSRTLSSYYPFAGTLEGDGNSINCNDRGACFLEAKIECPMNRILNNKDIIAQNVVYPREVPWSSSFHDDKLLIVQLSHFDCGGKAVSVCLSHKIADGASLCHFVKHWASVAQQSGDEEYPEFNGASLFPPAKEYHPLVPSGAERKPGITKRFVFTESKIRELKERAIKESGAESPSRIEVVSSFIYINAIISANLVQKEKCPSKLFKPSFLINAANLRLLTNPPIPQTIGCFSTVFNISTDEPEDMNFATLVSEFKKAKEKMKKRFNGLSTCDFFPAVDESFREAFTMPPSGSDVKNYKTLSPDIKDPQPPLPSSHTEEVNHDKTRSSIRDVKNYDSYIFSSLYNYGLAQVDFGFGTPLRVSTGAFCSNNFILLVDECGGKGMEALVALDEEAMSVFESNEDVLRYT